MQALQKGRNHMVTSPSQKKTFNAVYRTSRGYGQSLAAKTLIYFRSPNRENLNNEALIVQVACVE